MSKIERQDQQIRKDWSLCHNLCSTQRTSKNDNTMNDILTDIDKDLDVIFGEYKDQYAVDNFVKAARKAGLHGTLYIGYPVLAIDDERIEFDALLVSRDRGVIVFDLYSMGDSPKDDLTDEVVKQQEKLYAALYNRLNSFSELRSGRRLLISIFTAIIHPIPDMFSQQGENQIVSLNRLMKLNIVPDNDRLDDEKISHLNAAIQRISNLLPKKKRLNVKTQDSKGFLIKKIEKEIANLDLWQKRGSIEYVNGPQRIRGLAGSGKTVVLALKAAYLHVKRPDWDIVITFNTRSLYQQFENLINRFVFAQVSEEPDWRKLHIIHAWGGSDRTGVYKEYCSRTDNIYRRFDIAAQLFGYHNAFKGACDEAEARTPDKNLDMYDMMLVDEAQDLPSSFFRIAYRMVKDPKRIVWAYDDLQNLSDMELPSAKDLFGLDSDSRPRVTLVNSVDKPLQDIVLPRCYRNPPWTLLAAHGLGFGIHREPMAQMFNDPSIWERLGYSVKRGTLDFESDVEVVRAPDSIPSFFSKLLVPDDTLITKSFKSRQMQYEWVAEEIKTLMADEELEYSDILLVLPDARTSKSEGAILLKALLSVDLRGHIPGQTSSTDEVFRDGSIAITHIYRAKGNEAPVVFVLNSDFCEQNFGIKNRRNVLFTAITRSRAWTYILGVGPNMEKISSELAEIRKANFSLNFHYPSREAANKLAVSTDVIHDDEDPEAFGDLWLAAKKAKDNWPQLPADLRLELESLSSGGGV